MNRLSFAPLSIALAACALAVAPVHAETVSPAATAKFTASIAQTCTVTGTGISFGNYASTGANATTALDAQTTVAIKCTAGTASVVATLQAGAGPSATCDSADNYRAMKIGTSTTNLLSYKLYSDSQRTVEWGCAASNQQLVGPFTNSNTAVNTTVYGRIPPNQYLAPGAYSDTVEFRVVF